VDKKKEGKHNKCARSMGTTKKKAWMFLLQAFKLFLCLYFSSSILFFFHTSWIGLTKIRGRKSVGVGKKFQGSEKKYLNSLS